MTPERARELYRDARTMRDVLELFESRPERAAEVRLLRSLHPQHLSDPAAVLRTLRGMAADDDASAQRYEARSKAYALRGDHARASREAERGRDRERRARALRWAASALTRGLAFGAESNPMEEATSKLEP